VSGEACPDTEAQGRLMELINAGWTTQAVAAACEFDLPERLAHGPRTADELALDASVDVDALARLLRALTTLEICEEPALGTFTLGRLGHLLRRDHAQGLRHWAMLNGGPLWARWGALTDKVRTGHVAAHGDGSVERFRQLESDGREAALFHGAMTELSRRLDGSLADALVVPEGALVVDVGGGAGELLASVLARHPAARGILFDLAPALVYAPPVLGRHGVHERCALQEGSFFDGLPPQGDLYLMKSVLHDWGDEQAALILDRCRMAMKPGSRLVLVERPLPERVGTTPEDRALARSDLNMLVGLAGRERTLAQYCGLIERSGLALQRTQKLAAGFSAIEVVGDRDSIAAARRLALRHEGPLHPAGADR
jgi:orsellinic acid C2-O-methyltransferase